MRNRQLLLVGLSLYAVGACASPSAGDRARHIVLFDSEGSPVNAADPKRWGGYEHFKTDGVPIDGSALGPKDFLGHLDAMLEDIEAWDQQRIDEGTATLTDPVAVTVFIHGGLNKQKDTVKRAVRDSQRIQKDGSYPVFVGWDSSLISSYSDHVFKIRQGADWHEAGNTEEVLSWLTAPFVFAVDVIRSVSRLPLVITSQLVETFHWMGISKSRWRSQANSSLKNQQGSPWSADLPKEGPEEVDASWWEYLRYLVLSPLKVTSILIIDTGGTRSWDIMKRRVELLFQREKHLDGDGKGKRGRLLRVMQMLDILQRRMAAQGRELHVSVVGHSMGTIVLNRLLDHADMYVQPDLKIDPFSTRERFPVRLPCFQNIVYLAAACSVHDYEAAAFPYLQNHPATNAYHVMLHPDQEIREVNIGGIGPRGSLLTWVDEFLARPNTLLERTAGRYDNLFVTLAGTPAELVDRVHVRVLPSEQGKDYKRPRTPQSHGDFSQPLRDFQYWSPDSWRTPGLPAPSSVSCDHRQP